MKFFLIAGAVLCFALPALGASAPAKPLTVRGGLGHLVSPGDRAIVRYSVNSGSKAVRGTLYIRNDLQKTFTRVPLRRANNYTVRVPNRLIRGHRLVYHAVFRDPKSGRAITLTGSPVWILRNAVAVRLGAHAFGQTQAPEAIVARAAPSEVSWDITEEFRLGPQTFQVGADGSVWLEDSFADRLLAWSPGAPDHFARSVPVPYGAGISDIAFGPAGTVYVTKVLKDPGRLVLDRLNAVTGALVWEAPLAGVFQGGPSGDSYPITGRGSPLRTGPDGTLFCLVFMGRPGDEWGWMPVATPGGKPLLRAAQLRGIHWPFQPVAVGLRLLGGEAYTSRDDMAPHEFRYALVDRRDRVVRSWRILSDTDMNLHLTVPDFAGGDPVVVLEFRTDTQWEYEALRLGPHGAVAQLSLPHAVWGDNSLTDLRVGPDGKLYQLATSPTTGVTISRYSLGA
jgi:hypothetical protein